MDFYSYFKERFTWGHNPYTAIAQCQQTVVEMMENGRIPFCIAAESAIGFMTALADFAGDGCTVTYTYTTIQNLLTEHMERMKELVDARDKAYCAEVQAAEDGECGAPPYIPIDFESWPPDIAAVDDEPDDNLQDEPLVNPYDEAAALIAELYGSDGESGTTGTRRPFPDWDHIDNWTPGDWIQLQTYKDKILAAAGHDFFAVGSVTNALAAGKAAMCRIPLPRQVELAAWAEEVVDQLMVSPEDSLQEMCAGSLHSHAGRLVQKQMLSVTNEQPKNGL